MSRDQRSPCLTLNCAANLTILVVGALNSLPGLAQSAIGPPSAKAESPPSSMVASSQIEFRGACDGSAAVAPPGSRFVVVANDEDNVLRVYSNQGGAPIQEIDLVEHFSRPNGKKPEFDVEAATAIGSTTYWITSHGANKKGREKSARRQLFALTIAATDAAVIATPIGAPYTRLIEDLAEDKRFKQLNVHEAASKPPKTMSALNVEGLAATPDGGLLVGLRNPIPDGRAILIPILNPREVIGGGRVRLGAPVSLDLGGRGVRSIEYIPWRGEYLIAAGAYDGRNNSALFLWSGLPGAAPVPFGANANLPADFDIEALIPLGDAQNPEEVLALSDDGTSLVDGQECKRAKADLKLSRGISIAVPRAELVKNETKTQQIR